MIKTIIKRDGTHQPFQPEKLNGWGIWAASALGKQVNWGDVVINTVETLPENCTAVQLQNALIDQCLSRKTWAYMRMAGRLYASSSYKIAFNDKGYNLETVGSIPTIKALHEVMVDKNIIDPNFYNEWTDEEYAEIDKMLNHSLDLTYPFYQLKQIAEKYSLKDRTMQESLFETPQFVYMRVAMRMAMNKPNRLDLIAAFYKDYSQNKINIPTPYFTNSGTIKNGFSSCCLYKTDDDVKSLGAGYEIAYTMTYSSAGIGAALKTRSIGAPIRGGIIEHSGKVPYYRALVGMIKANLQNGRGGAATVTYDCFDPDVKTIQPLKNSMTPASKQVRGIDYSMAFCRFFAEKAARNEDVVLFDISDAPEVYDAMVRPELDFEAIYNKAVADGLGKSTTKAREILSGALFEAVETGRHYYTNLTEANTHTPFYEPIYQSNLCQEIFLPTHGYINSGDLYKTGDDVTGEVAMCSLASIVVGNIESDEEYAEVAYRCLLMIHTAIHEADYELPQIGYTAKARNSAGVGIAGLAHHLAKNKIVYNSEEGYKEMHRLGETHYWHLTNASLRMSKEYGNAHWIDKTKWPDGWLPVDTYNKNVDTIADFKNERDWEGLRARIVANGGIHNSVLVAHPPQESSSLSSGTTNGLYPIRNNWLIKTNDDLATLYVVPEYERYSKWYTIAWDMPSIDAIKAYGVFQKWTDQGISADIWKTVQAAEKLSSTELMRDFFATVKYGMKSRYYVNSKTSKDIDLNLSDAECEGCEI